MALNMIATVVLVLVLPGTLAAFEFSDQELPMRNSNVEFSNIWDDELVVSVSSRRLTAVTDSNILYSWHHLPFLGCSVSCGTGTQRSLVVCLSSVNNQPVQDYTLCDTNTQPEDKVRSCSLEACSTSRFQWGHGEWGQCTTLETCPSTMTRHVACIDTFNGFTVADGNCTMSTLLKSETRQCACGRVGSSSLLGITVPDDNDGDSDGDDSDGDGGNSDGGGHGGQKGNNSTLVVVIVSVSCSLVLILIVVIIVKKKFFNPTTTHTSSDMHLNSVVPSDECDKRFRVLYDYKSKHYAELDILAGDEIAITSETSVGGWMTGKCLRTKKTGVFPGNYVEAIHTT